MTLNMPGTIGGAKIVFINQNMEKIGIVGYGYVGEAIHQTYDGYQAVIIDIAKGFTNNYSELVDADAVFVCVPTPRNSDGSCDVSILTSVLAELKKVNYQGVIISKCTAPPAVYENLNKLYTNLVHVPEFLTAANALRDYIESEFVIIGGDIKVYRNEAERIIKNAQTGIKNIFHCSIGEAALAKYAINSFLATKVVFMNELWGVAVASGLDFNKIAHMITADKRIGRSHMKVPGPDGFYGFGGMCFPKDTEALLNLSKDLGVTMQVLEAALKKNTLLRLS